MGFRYLTLYLSHDLNSAHTVTAYTERHLDVLEGFFALFDSSSSAIHKVNFVHLFFIQEQKFKECQVSQPLLTFHSFHWLESGSALTQPQPFEAV